MAVKLFTYNNFIELCANTYIFSDGHNQCVIIDPSKEDVKIDEYIASQNLKVVGILLTHGHFDHIRAVDYFVNKYNVPFFMNQKDEELLTNPKLNCSDKFARKNIVVNSKPTFVKEGDKIEILDTPINVIETPFHTMGSTCYYLAKEKILFSGDSLFYGSVGRVDLPTSDSALFGKSLAKLMNLEETTIVYPGHGEKTTIKNERIQNSFVKI